MMAPTPSPAQIPPAVARAFFKAMNDYFIEANPIRRDAIAAYQLSILRQYQGPREKPLRLSDVRQMFEQMKDHRPTVAKKPR